jgi:hypothetical protein
LCRCEQKSGATVAASVRQAEGSQQGGPFGATVGDFLDKPVSDGGLAPSRPLASVMLAIFILGCLLILP